MQNQLTTCLWFDGKAEAAAHMYTSIFKGGSIGKIVYASSGVPGTPEGAVLVVPFEIMGQKFIGLNGGPQFHFSEALSLCVNCDTQEEIDYFWAHLTADGGEEGPCGWCKDKFGLSWQVAPANMDELLGDSTKGAKVMAAMMTMKKLDKAALEEAHKAG